MLECNTYSTLYINVCTHVNTLCCNRQHSVVLQVYGVCVVILHGVYVVLCVCVVILHGMYVVLFE